MMDRQLKYLQDSNSYVCIFVVGGFTMSGLGDDGMIPDDGRIPGFDICWLPAVT